jgi:hypothetical protein
LLGQVRIEPAGDDGLSLRFEGEGAYSARLEHWHRDVFRLVTNGVRFTRGFVDFTIGPSGGVASMRAFGSEFVPAG